MKNRYKFILLTVFAFIFIWLAGCSSKNLLDKYKEKGNVIRVSYDSNGGTYIDRDGITIIDLLNPDKYQADSNGTKHIKLLSPTDPNRKSGGSEGVYITRTNYFLVGWYKNKELRKNQAGNPVNEAGDELVLIDDEYYLASDNNIKATPAYDYSGYWDFDNDTIEYTSDMDEYEMTLYAVWSEYFEFNYYFEIDGKWEKQESITTFDYVTTNALNSKTSDKDTIWTPSYVNGAMNYNHKYQSSGEYKFPKLEGYTFKAAYLDENKTKPIEESYEHKGSIDYTTGKAINPIENIYVTLDKGEYYYISNPQQLIDNANLNGIYYIENDLDFEGLKWPQLFDVGTFNGKFISNTGSNVIIKNVSVTHNSDNAKVGGLFGKISGEAEFSNITFENATLDLSYVGTRNRDTSFGLFAGIIEDDAKINNVYISGKLKIGNIAPGDGYQIGLVTGNGSNKVNVLSDIVLEVYGTENGDVYKFTIDPDAIKVENDLITLKIVTSLTKDNKSYIINYKEEK